MRFRRLNALLGVDEVSGGLLGDCEQLV